MTFQVSNDTRFKTALESVDDFDGRPGSLAFRWWETLQHACLGDPELMKAIFHVKMSRGPAFTWYSSLPDEVKDVWEVLKGHFMKAFFRGGNKKRKGGAAFSSQEEEDDDDSSISRGRSISSSTSTTTDDDDDDYRRDGSSSSRNKKRKYKKQQQYPKTSKKRGESESGGNGKILTSKMQQKHSTSMNKNKNNNKRVGTYSAWDGDEEQDQDNNYPLDKRQIHHLAADDGHNIMRKQPQL